MYSVVLLAALSTSAAEPSCCFRCRPACCGCYGACYGCYGGCYGCYGAYNAGCYGCGGGCYGSGVYSYGIPMYSPYSPMATPPAAPAAPAAPAKDPEKVKPPKEGEASAQNRARLIVSVPADAKLYIDGNLTSAKAVQRVFRTPVLNPRQTYYYELRAEVVRDGKTVSQSQRVILRAGEDIRAAFANLPETPVESTASAAR